MIRNSIKLLAVLGGLAVLGLLLSSPVTEARPQYFNQFKSDYPKLATAAQKEKCVLCHDARNKRVRNAYGGAVSEGLTKRNEKFEPAITRALKKAEAAKSPGGKTFGEMIEAGELPE
ncbi:MAG TPA: hypothetical protein VMM56_05855 [Planctomycetaceae bacterium]|nr:hypothetical protein [Planctomycetaceae bacterium]